MPALNNKRKSVSVAGPAMKKAKADPSPRARAKTPSPKSGNSATPKSAKTGKGGSASPKDANAKSVPPKNAKKTPIKTPKKGTAGRQDTTGSFVIPNLPTGNSPIKSNLVLKAAQAKRPNTKKLVLDALNSFQTKDSAGESSVVGPKVEIGDGKFKTQYPLFGFGTFHIKEKELGVISEACVLDAFSDFFKGDKPPGALFNLLDTAKVYDNEKALKCITQRSANLTKESFLSKDISDRFGDSNGKGKGKEKHADLPPDILKTRKDSVYPLQRDPKTGESVQVDEKTKKSLGNVLLVSTEVDPLLFIQSKQWRSRHGYVETTKCFNESCNDMGLFWNLTPEDRKKVKKEYADDNIQKVQRCPMGSYLIHHPDRKVGWPLKNNPDGTPGGMPAVWNPPFERNESYRALEDLYLDGRVKAIGVSNYSERHLRELLQSCRIKPHVLQIEFHPLYQMNQLVEYAQREGILVQVYGSLGSTDANDPTLLLQNPTIKAVADEVNKTLKDRQVTTGQVLLRWALQRGCAVIPKSTKVKRIIENSKLWDFTLTEAQMKSINGMNEGSQGRKTWKGEDIDGAK